jgi:hypothetical protein
MSGWLGSARSTSTNLTNITTLDFADGTVVLLHDLVPGQRASVLQLPAHLDEHGRRSERVADDGSTAGMTSDAEIALT